MQGFIVGVIILLAFLFFIRRVRRAVRAKGVCSCGCSACSRRPQTGAAPCASCTSLKKAGE